MKHLKAYTFEELLCEIPELEKYKETYKSYTVIGINIIPILEKFAKQNKLQYLEFTHLFNGEDKILYFLFEKI